MITKKEFYFVRHGQTDHNILEGPDKGEHPSDIPLNKTGRAQAIAIAPIISSLPIQVICTSPMRRVQETKEIIAGKLQVPHYEVPTLRECSSKIWKEMASLGMYAPLPTGGEAKAFMERVKDGVNHALSFPGPSLIVAHGGIHWAICCLIGIQDHEWRIDNCGVIHFFITDNGHWRASRLV